jgi:hypothetical protein
VPVATPTIGGGSSLRFHGNGVNDIDRVKIKLDAPARPIDVDGDFTLEWWMKAPLAENGGDCGDGTDNWITGNILFDRDVYGNGDTGDFGVSLCAGRIAFGVNRLGNGTGIRGATVVTDGAWHHVAATRNATTGTVRIWVDGALDGEGTGPTGGIAYRDGRATSWPNSDPYLVIGAEKHDAGVAYPSYSGWIDEVRASNIVRYTVAFTPPAPPFATDANTVALYHFDEGSGTTITDASGVVGGPSTGVLRFGGNPAGPEWSSEVP